MRNVEDLYPLSPTQQGLLFRSLYTDQLQVYVEQISWRLEGQVDSASLQFAWQQVLARHPILRTAFFWNKLEQPLQVVRDQAELTWNRYDLRALSEAERLSQWSSHLISCRRQPFDLTRAPLMRMAEFQLTPDSYHYIWNYHHLLLDAWSVTFVLGEVFRFYAARRQGLQLNLARRRPYRDYIVWLQQQNVSLAQDHWRQILKGFTEPTRLLVEKELPAGPEEANRYDQQTVSTTIKDSGALRTFARRHHLTLNTVVQGAWALILSRYSNQKDIVFGNVVSSRPTALPGFAEMIGLFINTLPLRVSWSSEQRVLSFLQRIQAQQSATQRYEYVSLKQVREWSDIAPGQPLFNSLVVFDNTPVNENLISGSQEFSIRDVTRADTLTEYPLTLEVLPKPEIDLRLIYDGCRFERPVMLRMLGHLQEVLEGFTRGADQTLARLPLLTELERQQLLVNWGSAREHVPVAECLHELFAAQVERTPDRIAITFEQTTLTYRCLNGRANWLARKLRQRGVGPETLVGICLENSVAMVIGILAILKAGAAYVPLDPAFPGERLAFMLADAHLSILLTDRLSRKSLPDYDGEIIFIDDGEDASSEIRANAVSDTTADNLAYVIYTSGSTGRPKGVQISHGNVTQLFAAARGSFAFNEHDVWTLFHSCSFDFSVWELFGALLHGGRLVIVPYQQSRAPESFYRLLIDEQVTVLSQTPSAFKQLLKADKVSDGELALRWVIFGGEALSPQSLAPWFERHGAAKPRLANMYGITETTVHVTCYELSERDTAAAAGSVIGRALATLQSYVLDDHLLPVPIGLPGELFVGGAGLARGYLNLPALTAERFVPNPFGSAAGARLYRSGDLVRYLPDGELEYLARVDNQVKIRGFRIEPEEIETILRTHPDVQEAVVVAGNNQHEPQLIAYVVQHNRAPLAARQLRRLLLDRLPNYMIPAQFVALESLPLTPTGKVDRRAVLTAQPVHFEKEEPFTPPSTPSEKTLAEIWSRTLGLKDIGMHDNFFALGGDSVLSMQIVSRAAQAGFRFSPRDIFQHQTIAELALVGETHAAQADQGTVAGSVPLTPIQRWFFEQQPLDPHHYNQSLLLETPERLSIPIVIKVVEHLLAHHDALRLRFTPAASGWQQFNAAAAGASVFSYIDLAELTGQNRASAIAGAATRLQASLDLANGPLLRLALFDCGAQESNRLLLIIHHLAVDGVSWQILLEDFQTAYAQLSQGLQVRLPAKTTSFKRWAETLSELAQVEKLKRAECYWESEAWQATRPLPRDHAEGENIVASAGDVRVSLSVDDTKALLQEVPPVYHTQINDVLLTALALAFSRWTKTGLLRLDLEGHGRDVFSETVDVSRTIGWFTNLFPVLLEVKPAEEPGATLKAVKEQLRAIPNAGINYGLLRYLSSDRIEAARLLALPQAEVLFNYLGQFDQLLSQSPLFRLARGGTGSARSLRAERSHLLEFNCGIEAGCFQLVCSYSRNLHQRTTIETLALDFIAELKALIRHCQQPHAGGHTPSDFPLAGLAQESLDVLSIEDRQIEDILSLSPMQAGMLFHALRSPDSNAYFEQLSWRLDGPVDAAALASAWQGVVDSHPILRTSFVWQDVAEPVQIIHRKVDLPLPLHDWSELSPREQQERLEEQLRDDRSRGFDLSKAPLMRIVLIRLAEHEYFFIWSHHHILLDGWSVTLLLQEVFSRYEALLLNRPAPLEPRRRYRDYIGWLRQQDLSKAEAFWRATLKGFTSPTPLVSEHAHRSSVDRKTTSDSQQVSLSAELTKALADFARTHGLTMNTIIQGAWALLVSRYSGEDDVTFGVTVAGRPTEILGVETMLGLFINTLPLRIRISREDNLLPWLKAIQDQQTAQTPYEFSPLARVQGWSEAPGGVPLFQSILVFENYPSLSSISRTSGGIKIGDVHKPTTADYPLMLVAVPGAELSLKLVGDSAYFDVAAITRMLDNLVSLLTSIADGSKQRLLELPLLAENERHEVLFGWNDTKTLYPEDQCFPQAFEAQMSRTPTAVAAVFGDQQLSYSQLNSLANRLASRLRKYEVGPESRIAIMLPRSLDLLVALLGIMKSGAAFVPLDIAYPHERLAYLLEDAGVSAVVTQERFQESVNQTGAPALYLDNDYEAMGLESEQNPAVRLHPANLAYALYTSGSTGTPKGVLIEHRSLMNYLCWVNETLFDETVCTIPVVTDLTFDASLKQLLAPLLSGNTVRILAADGSDSLAFLNGLNEQSGVGLNCVPSLWKAALDSLQTNGGAARSLRRLYLGGEKFDSELVERSFTLSPDLEIWNLYGPTEATANAIAGPLRKGKPILIGRPISNLQVYLLDKHLRPVPVGVAGEIYIGGAGVARGYLNRPELTAASFIPNPFGCESGARLYRTGDLARYLPEGNIEYLRRNDQQVKLRGYRIELGEIESVLKQHALVEEAVVQIVERSSGGKQLIAYVVPQAETVPAAVELSSFVAKKVPFYMAPSVFIVIETLPLMDNGKIDRQALPLPVWEEGQAEKVFVGPRTEAETILANIWSEVLAVKPVGIHDDFFELGGDSILSIRIIARAAQEGIKFTPNQLFDNPTIAGVMGCVAGTTPRDAMRTALPLTLAQRSLSERCDDLSTHTRLIALEARQNLDRWQLAQVWRQLLVHHDALRLCFTRNSRGAWQQTDPGPGDDLQITELDVSLLTPAHQELAVRNIIAGLTSTLKDHSMVRLILCRRGAALPNLLLLVINRLVADEASCNIVLEDFQLAYEQLSKGAPIKLPRATSSFWDWAEGENHRVQSDLSGHEARWLQELPEDAPRLPLDSPEAADGQPAIRALSLLLTSGETSALVDQVTAVHRIGINEALLMAVLQGLAHWTGRRMWLIALKDDGRDDDLNGLNLTRTVGCFSTFAPASLSLSATGHLAESLLLIKEKLGRIQQRGWSYAVARHYDKSGVLLSLPQAEISFAQEERVPRTWLDTSLLRPFPEVGLPNRGSLDPPECRLNFRWTIMEDQLQLSWIYDEKVHSSATIQRLAEAARSALRSLIAYSEIAKESSLTASDFPDAHLKQRELDLLLSQLSEDRNPD